MQLAMSIACMKTLVSSKDKGTMTSNVEMPSAETMSKPRIWGFKRSIVSPLQVLVGSVSEPSSSKEYRKTVKPPGRPSVTVTVFTAPGSPGAMEISGSGG